MTALMNEELQLCEEGFGAHIKNLEMELEESRRDLKERSSEVKRLEGELSASVTRASKAKERMLTKAQRGLERALVKGAEEAELVWDREKAYMTARLKELTEENEKRWSVEEAFTEAKRQDRPLMELLYEKQCLEAQVKRLHTDLAAAEEN